MSIVKSIDSGKTLMTIFAQFTYVIAMKRYKEV
jgi:hypothetical protein